MKLSSQSIRKLCLWESPGGKPNLTAYQDQGGVWTIGYGFVRGVHEGDTITEDAANLRLGAELIEYEAAVTKACTGPTTQNQFDALVILAWNIGLSGFRSSTALKAHNRGDYAAAARAIGLWNKITINGVKVVSNGLVNRRAKEVALYTEPDAALDPVAVPQAVAPPVTPAKSGINQAQIIAGGTAAAATVTQIVDQVSAVKTSTDSLGSWLIPVLLIVTLIAVGYTLWSRYQHAKQGDI